MNITEFLARLTGVKKSANGCRPSARRMMIRKHPFLSANLPTAKSF